MYVSSHHRHGLTRACFSFFFSSVFSSSFKIGAQIAGVIARLAFMSAGVDSEFPFTMVVDDPSGNSFVENPSAPNKDPALTVSGPGVCFS